MSVPVDLHELASALADFTFAYLITVSDDHRAHAIAVEPVLAGGVFDVGTPGTTTSRNLKQHANLTLVWPPREADGYTLIVDGTGALDNGSLRVTPARAVLHRRGAAGRVGPADCPHDCMPL